MTVREAIRDAGIRSQSQHSGDKMGRHKFKPAWAAWQRPLTNNWNHKNVDLKKKTKKQKPLLNKSNIWPVPEHNCPRLLSTKQKTKNKTKKSKQLCDFFQWKKAVNLLQSGTSESMFLRFTSDQISHYNHRDLGWAASHCHDGSQGILLMCVYHTMWVCTRATVHFQRAEDSSVESVPSLHLYLKIGIGLHCQACATNDCAH